MVRAVNLCLRYDPVLGACDLVPDQDTDGMETEALIALLSHARVDESEVPPGTPLRGYWADSLDPTGEQTGSRLWLLERALATEANVRLAEQYTADALRFLVTSKRAKAIDVAGEIEGEAIFVRASAVLRTGRVLPLTRLRVNRA